MSNVTGGRGEALQNNNASAPPAMYFFQVKSAGWSARTDTWWALFLVVVVDVFLFMPVHAAHPLITEDTGTQGRGAWQLELTSEFGFDDAAETRARNIETATVISYGMANTLECHYCHPLCLACGEY